MTTFLTIFFIILGVNLVLMFFSVIGMNQSTKKSSSEITETAITKIRSIDLITSEYKKAI